MAKNTFTDRDKGFKKLFAKFEAEKGKAAVFVGFLRSSGVYQPKPKSSAPKNPPKPITIAQIAAIHEFGSKDGTIPERSFMRSAIDANKKQIEKLLKKLLLAVLEGKQTRKVALGLVGEFVSSKMKKRITDGLKPALKAATVKRKKGKSTPLIDTGQLINSIDWEVQEGVKKK
jgi:phage gpG-like protein